MSAGHGSKGNPDFARLGDLLGDACEGPADVPVGPAVTAAPGRRTSTRPPSPARERVFPGSRDPARHLALIWPDIVGAEVAANARPVQLKGGRLTVSASSAAWAQTLQFMGSDICARLRETLGAGVVEQVVFRHAGWDEPAQRSTCRSSGEAPAPEPAGAPGATDGSRGRPLSPEQIDALAALEEMDLPGDLRARITRAMEAAFVRGEQDIVR